MCWPSASGRRSAPPWSSRGDSRRSAGGDLQERIVAIAREASFPFVGPNCLGIYVPSHVDTFFLPGERMVKPVIGNVSFVSQSGGILVDQLIKFASEGVGLAKAISIGNKALLGELELLDYLAEDPATRVIAFYIEGFGQNEGRAFVLEAGKCGKPVIVLKSGKSPGGSKAVSSHTASLAGDYASFSAALSQYGIVEAANELELVSFCESLSTYQKPIEGRVGIVTVSGGHGAMAVDACTARGIVVPELPEEVREDAPQGPQPERPGDRLAHQSRSTSPEAGSTTTSWPPPETLFAMEEIDCVLALLLPYIPGITSDLGAKLSSVAGKYGKPLIAYVPHVEKYAMLIEGFELNGAPVSPSDRGGGAHGGGPEEEQAMIDSRPEILRIIEAARADGWVLEPDAKRLFSLAGFDVPRFTLARTPEEAIRFAGEIGYPVVAKVVSPRILHKSDVGGVVVGIADDGRLAETFRRFQGSGWICRHDCRGDGDRGSSSSWGRRSISSSGP